MADSIEQKIMTAIVERLGEIDGTGDYLTEIGARVEDSRPNWDQNELPAISVFEGTVTSDEADDEGIRVNRTMPVMIKCFFAANDDAAANAAFARQAMSDIMRAIRSDDTWIVSGARLARFTTETSHGIEYAAESTFEITGVQVAIEIGYVGSKFNLEA
jgi:hypothetical protein